MLYEIKFVILRADYYQEGIKKLSELCGKSSCFWPSAVLEAQKIK